MCYVVRLRRQVGANFNIIMFLGFKERNLKKWPKLIKGCALVREAETDNRREECGRGLNLVKHHGQFHKNYLDACHDSQRKTDGY